MAGRKRKSNAANELVNQREYLNFLQFLSNKIDTSESSFDFKTVCEEFLKETESRTTVKSLKKHVTSRANDIYKLTQLDENVKVKLMYGLGAVIKKEFRIQLEKDAVVLELDTYRRIIKYESKSGFKLDGVHKRSRQRAKANDARNISNFHDSSEEEDDEIHDSEDSDYSPSRKKIRRRTSGRSEQQETHRARDRDDEISIAVSGEEEHSGSERSNRRVSFPSHSGPFNQAPTNRDMEMQQRREVAGEPPMQREIAPFAPDAPVDRYFKTHPIRNDQEQYIQNVVIPDNDIRNVSIKTEPQQEQFNVPNHNAPPVFNERDGYTSHEKVLESLRTLLLTFNMNPSAESLIANLNKAKRTNEMVSIDGIKLGMETLLHLIKNGAKFEAARDEESIDLGQFLVAFKSAIISLRLTNLDVVIGGIVRELQKASNVASMRIPVGHIGKALDNVLYIISTSLLRRN